MKNEKLTLSVQDKHVSFYIFKTVPLCDKGDTCFSINSVITHEKDDPCSNPPLATNRVDSSLSLNKEAHDHQLAPKFEAVNLKTKVKKKKKKGMAKHFSLFKQYGRLKILKGDQKIKTSKKKLKEYIKCKINVILLKDPD